MWLYEFSGCTAVNSETIETLECIMNIVKHMWDVTQICTQENPKNVSGKKNVSS